MNCLFATQKAFPVSIMAMQSFTSWKKNKRPQAQGWGGAGLPQQDLDGSGRPVSLSAKLGAASPLSSPPAMLSFLGGHLVAPAGSLLSSR